MTSKITPAERQINLILALRNTRHGMTRAQIFNQVTGYNPQASSDAQERMFERDKEILRKQGLEIITLDVDGPADQVRYRITQPATSVTELTLSNAQLTVLQTVAKLWDGTEWGVETERAMQKLRGALTPASEDDAPAKFDLSVRLQPVQPVLVPLARAIQDGQRVQFDYQPAQGNGETKPRLVEPWRIYFRDGGRYLVGHDCDRQAQRTFKLNRIQGEIKPVGPVGAFTAPDAAASPPTPQKTYPVTVLLDPARAHQLRQYGSQQPLTDAAQQFAGQTTLEEWEPWTLHFDSQWQAHQTLLAAGAEVVVLEPKELRTQMLQSLRHLAKFTAEGVTNA